MSKPQNRVRLTAGRVDAFTCPAGKSQAFLWDTEAPALALRVTPTGRKTYVFESRLNGATLRLSIGTAADWPLEKARGEAQRLKVLVDSGTDPRELERQQQAAQAAERAAAVAKVKADKVAAVTVGEVWADYLEKRRPFWGELHYRDHIDKAKAGGLPSGRRGGGKQLTKPGPLAALMPLALKDLDQATIERWAANEGKTRPSSARLAWRLLTVFLTWCAEQPEYANLLPDKNPAKTKKAREALGKAGTKSDVLQREQLAAWFAAVQQIQNPVIAACLQMMLLTGARPGEVLALRWEDVNTQWKGISIRDKVEGTREIPATPYMLHLLAALPRRNEWVFSSPTSASGCLTEPNNPHTRACAAAGLEGLTLHGLRRSFASLTEWLEVPAGVVAQIQGHKPSATAEKHYKVRPLELLRVHHERIEAWILEQAGIVFDAQAEPGKLRVVGAA
ncbi:tyrosine-type recombinase/integrase [Acidovorax temperans]|uniref:tyrosine-type recombinase/integrase n=1 Tax=Acidovorax temperans TaxID=80878 RepID=UPI001A93E7F4|nr:integrase family protein [Acidovorax temperans]MBO0940468.1 integrase family protein [Acidovorax temperans]WCT25572.1 integrase family protein [Acidovorax temperans]